MAARVIPVAIGVTGGALGGRYLGKRILKNGKGSIKVVYPNGKIKDVTEGFCKYQLPIVGGLTGGAAGNIIGETIEKNMENKKEREK